jgi:hypothetical protein
VKDRPAVVRLVLRGKGYLRKGDSKRTDRQRYCVEVMLDKASPSMEEGI